MKGIIVASVIILLVGLIILVAYRSNSFMGWHDVASGDYYLLAENGSLLFDDPQILKKYRYQINVRKPKIIGSVCDGKSPLEVIALSVLCVMPRYEQGDTTLQLRHKEQGLIRALADKQIYSMPPTMYKTAKRLGADEVWYNPEAFLQRINQLKTIEGVSILRASEIKPPVIEDLDEEYTVNIYLPLLIAEYKKNIRFPADKIKTYLKQRLEQRLSQLEVTHYQITTIKHHRHGSTFVGEGKTFLNAHYKALRQPVEDGMLSYMEREYLSIPGYQVHLFVMQVKCNQFCANSLEKEQQAFAKWLSSEISHADFIDKVKAVIEQAGGSFDAEFILLDDRVNLPPDYVNKPKSYDFAGKVEVIQKEQPKQKLILSWKYDLGHALNRPYPPELAEASPN